jgi:hypothetical protein
MTKEEEMGQQFSIVRRTKQGVAYFQVTNHRTHRDYKVQTRREATKIAKLIESGHDSIYLDQVIGA